MGIESIEILFPNQWETVAKHGLECAMGRPRPIKGIGGIGTSFEKKENHDTLVKIYEPESFESTNATTPTVIPATAAPIATQVQGPTPPAVSRSLL